MSELEEAIGSNLWPLEQLKAPQKILRAFRRLLFLDTETLIADANVSDLPPVIILHHLYSRGPSDLQLPHVEVGFTYKQVTPPHHARKPHGGVLLCGNLFSYDDEISTCSASGLIADTCSLLEDCRSWSMTLPQGRSSQQACSNTICT